MQPKNPSRGKKLFFLFLIFAGCALLCANVAGIALDSRVWHSAKPWEIPAAYVPHDRTTFDPGRKKDESALAFAARMNAYVHNHTLHYYFDENTLDNIGAMTAPFSWSWPLWACGLVAAATNNKFTVEFCDSQTALERGYGYCSQRALILQDLLRRGGLSAHVADLSGHVVCLLRHQGRQIVLDPDFGAIIPHSLDSIRDNPDILARYMDPKGVAYVRAIYAAGNWPRAASGDYDCFSRLDLLAISAFSWFAPLTLICLGSLGLGKIRKPAGTAA